MIRNSTVLFKDGQEIKKGEITHIYTETSSSNLVGSINNGDYFIISQNGEYITTEVTFGNLKVLNHDIAVGDIVLSNCIGYFGLEKEMGTVVDIKEDINRYRGKVRVLFNSENFPKDYTLSFHTDELIVIGKALSCSEDQIDDIFLF